MENWQIALEKFLKEWKDKKGFEGALLTGSYAVGAQSATSDIDVMIVLSDETKFWQRGNTNVDGFLIEYIADPTSMWQKSFEDDFNAGRKVSVCMFATGTVLFDKTGLVSELKTKSEEIMAKKFNKMDERAIEMAKYHLYDGLDKLRNLERNGFTQYAPLYYLQLSKIINFYAASIGISVPATAKLYKFINDSQFRDKYKLEGFSDRRFIDLVNKSLENYSSIKSIDDLTLYILDKMGGFKIDGWVLKTKID